jgi:GPH family glycoside/pentoside/hexuronide:cation symporter
LLGLGRKIGYASGNFGTSMLYNAFSSFVLVLYITYVGLSGTLYGIIFIVYGIWMAVNDPVFGVLSDRTRTRWGRRRPYVGIGAIFLFIFYFLVWTPPVQGTLANPWDMTVFIYLLLVMVAFGGFYTLVSVPYIAMFPELYENPKERGQVQLFRQLFAAFGLILAFMMPMLISNLMTSMSVFEAYKYVGLVLGFLGFIPYIVSIVTNKERKEFSVDPNLSLRKTFGVTLRNKSFLMFALASLMINFAFLWMQGLLEFFSINFLGIQKSDVTILLMTMFISALPFLPIWGRAYRKFGTRKSFIVSNLILVLALQPFLIVSGLMSAIPLMVIAGVGLSGYMMLPELMVSEIIDEDEIKTKVRREGVYFGMSAFVSRLAFSMEGVAYALLFSLTGYSGQGPPTPEINIVFRAAFTLIPLLAFVLAIVGLKFYGLHGKRLEQVRKDMEKMHAEKAKRLKGK